MFISSDLKGAGLVNIILTFPESFFHLLEKNIVKSPLKKHQQGNVRELIDKIINKVVADTFVDDMPIYTTSYRLAVTNRTKNGKSVFAIIGPNNKIYATETTYKQLLKVLDFIITDYISKNTQKRRTLINRNDTAYTLKRFLRR